MIGSIHQGTVNNLQLGAGLLLRDLPWEEARDCGELRALIASAVEDGRGVLGATRGGGSFTCIPALRQLDADGVRTPFVGGTLCDGWQVRMTGTLLEITPENMALLLAAANVERDGSRTTVTARTALRENDYLTNLCWVGDTASGLMLIELMGALNMGGAALNIRDRGEGSMSFVFQAHALSAQAQDTAPFRIVFLT